MDHHHHFKDHKFSPISFSPDAESQQFVMSYNKATERKPDDLIEMTTCTAEPSMNFVIDSHNLSHGPATNHVTGIGNGTIAGDDNDRNPSSARLSARSPESDFVADQKQQSPSWTPISGCVSANENHKNSDSHSTRSTVTPDYAFLQVSDIDAQAQPIKAQPLLGQQPKLLNKKESAAKGSNNLANHCHTPTSVAHTTSSSNMPHVDKKADVNPTSASAAAAMKEAMDFAEARLKAAKELLERKGDSFKLRKKSSHHRSSRSTEIKAPVCAEEDTSIQKLSVKKSSKEEKNPDGSLYDKHTKLSAVRFDHSDENGKTELPLEKPQQMMPHSAESCQTSSKLEKLGKWKSVNDFFELTGDDQKCETDATIREDDKRERMDHISVINDHSETVLSTADSDLERYEKLWEVNDGRNLGVKHVDLREGKIAPVDKDRVSVILEASTENMAPQKTHSSVGMESHDADECLGLPSVSDASAKLDVIKDMPDSLPEACSSGNASDLRDVGDSIPKVSPVAGASQDSKLEQEVPCSGGMQCTSGSSEKLQEPSDASNVAISQGSNIKSLILEELQESDVCDAFLRPRVSRIDQEAETYGREKFSFIAGSLLHNKGAKINEVLSEEVERVEIEEKVNPCTHPGETVVDLDAECPEDENDIILQNDNLADREESNMLNVFEVASKLIKRELDQEMHGSLGHQVDHMEEGMDGLISDVNNKETDETPLENIDRTGFEEGPAPCNHDDQKSPESTNRGQSDVDAKLDTTSNEVGSESFSGDEGTIKAASDSSSRATINLNDDPASSSEMYTHMQHSVRKDDSATSQTSCSAPGLGEIGEVSNRREGELPTERSTREETGRASKMEEKDTTTRISKADHRPSPFETTHSPTKSAEAPTPVSADLWKKEALGVQRENITRADSATDKDKASSRKAQEAKDSATDKDKGSSRKAQEAKESEKRLEKQRELAEEKERQKLEEEERERERKKDRLAVERATREAHERAFAEAREKAEKMAMERITAARQRASAEAREKEERTSAEAAAERATREARIKAERAAVERATAEARERAIEKAKAEKALAEARERRERYRSSFKEGFKSNQVAVVEVESALRHKARLERHQRTTERVSKALAEKNRRDMLAQREQAEKHRLSEFLDPEIKRWSNGKEGNLRALLSTLQYILGADSGWQPVPLTDLITAVAVKKAYRKAALCVHPDKVQQRGATIRQKYICEKVFDLLKDAWNKFTSEER
nr:unnamed protein product [Digitaria exilis]